ncbi:MAG: tetratricopeptide repeat protein [Planctomycetaceae bacterium]|nr:tetratricopeptide repeat protein [Planctomycetaceae bacterium]
MKSVTRGVISIALLILGTSVGLSVEIGDVVRAVRNTALRVEAQAVATVPSGTELKVEDINGDWLWVTYAGKQGWVSGQDVAGDTPLLDEWIKLEPENAGLYQMRGLLLMSQDKLDKAMQDFQTGVRLAPNDPQSYNCRGTAWYRLGKYDEAIADFDRVLQLDPQNADAVRNRGSCRRAKKEYDAAIADYDEALRRKPENADVYSDRGDVWRFQGDYEKALADYDESLKLDPKNVTAYFYRGWIWDELGKPDKAIAEYTAALKLNPKYVDAYINRGNALQNKGEYSKAVADYDQAIALAPRYAIALYNRGNSYRELGRHAAAEADYRSAVDIDPQFAAAYSNLALTLATAPDAKSRNGAEAVKYALKACELNQWKRTSNIVALAAAYAEDGKFDLAVKYQRQAVQAAGQELKAEFQERLELYQSGKPYHEKAGAK